MTRYGTVQQVFCAVLLIACAATAQTPTAQMTMPPGRRLDIVSETDDSITVVDSRGKNVTLAKNPKRVLPIYTSYLNVWYECGGTAVGRPTASLGQLPQSAEFLPAVGRVTNPNMEKIFALKPDLVLMRYGFADHSRLAPMLESTGIPYLSLTYETFEDYRRVVDVFSRLTGRPDIRTDSLRIIQEQVDSVIAAVPKGGNPRVLILFGSAMGVVVKLPGSLVGSMIEDLGAENIASDAALTSDEMQVFSMERVVERDPEVILVQTMGSPKMVSSKIRKSLASNPAWKTLSAVKNNRVHYLPVNGFLYKPNKRFPECYRHLAGLLYPEGSE